MPTYDFRCGHCRLGFEVRRRFDEDAADAACPVDGAPAVRLFTPPLGALVYGATTSTPVSSIRPPGDAPSGPAHRHAIHHAGDDAHAGGHAGAAGHTHAPGTPDHTHPPGTPDLDH